MCNSCLLTFLDQIGKAENFGYTCMYLFEYENTPGICKNVIFQMTIIIQTCNKIKFFICLNNDMDQQNRSTLDTPESHN